MHFHTMRTLVIGVGNLLRCDDGVGIHVADKISQLGLGIDAIDVGLGSVEILEAMKGYDKVFIVDATVTGSKPGTVHIVEMSKGEAPLNITHSHGVDILTTLRLGERLYDGLPEVTLIGVEAGDTISLDESCTPEVEEAIDRVIEIIRSRTGA